jgi:hypothetical protein
MMALAMITHMYSVKAISRILAIATKKLEKMNMLIPSYLRVLNQRASFLTQSIGYLR